MRIMNDVDRVIRIGRKSSVGSYVFVAVTLLIPRGSLRDRESDF